MPLEAFGARTGIRFQVGSSSSWLGIRKFQSNFMIVPSARILIDTLALLKGHRPAPSVPCPSSNETDCRAKCISVDSSIFIVFPSERLSHPKSLFPAALRNAQFLWRSLLPRQDRFARQVGGRRWAVRLFDGGRGPCPGRHLSRRRLQLRFEFEFEFGFLLISYAVRRPNVIIQYILRAQQAKHLAPATPTTRPRSPPSYVDQKTCESRSWSLSLRLH